MTLKTDVQMDGQMDGRWISQYPRFFFEKGWDNNRIGKGIPISNGLREE